MKTFFVVIAALLSGALAGNEGSICTELDESLTRLATALPECAAEEGIEGAEEVRGGDGSAPYGGECSVDNAVSRSFFFLVIPFPTLTS